MAILRPRDRVFRAVDRGAGRVAFVATRPRITDERGSVDQRMWTTRTSVVSEKGREVAATPNRVRAQSPLPSPSMSDRLRGHSVHLSGAPSRRGVLNEDPSRQSSREDEHAGQRGSHVGMEIERRIQGEQ